MPEVFDYFVDDNKATFAARVWYFVNALFAVSPPIYLYHSLYGVDIEEMYWLYASVTIVAAFLLSFAYHNVSYWIRHRLDTHRDETITANMISNAYGKKDKKKVQTHKEEQKKHTHSESSSFAILYNNLFFLFIFFVVGFYFFPSIPAIYNYCIAVLGSALLVNFVSTSALKK